MSTSTPSGLAPSVPVPHRRNVSASRILQRTAIGLSLALLIGLVLSYGTLLQSGAAGPKKTDFIPYFSAAHLVDEGRGGAMYSFHQLGQFESALVRPLKVKDSVMPYLYPPYFALALTPLGLLPYTTAYLLWVLLNVLLLVGSLAMLQRHAGLQGSEAVLFWAASLSFLPVLVGLAQGQTSIVLLALFTGVLVALRGGREYPAGCMLAGALVKPTYVLPVLAVLVLGRRWKAVAAFAATAAALLLVPMGLLGRSIYEGYGNTLLQASGWRTQIGGFEAKWNHSLAGQAQLLLPGRTATVATAALCLVCGVLFLVTSRRMSRTDVPIALAVVVGLLLSPHVLVHDLTLLLIPGAVAVRLRPFSDRTLPWVLAGVYGAVLVGLALVGVARVQLSVVAMICLAWWFLTQGRMLHFGALGVTGYVKERAHVG